MTDTVKKTDAEWREQLTREQYDVTRKAGTERAFTGQYHDCKDAGTYVCICCGEPLFSSDTKFDSGTGWPSYYQPVSPDAVVEHEDVSFFMRRVEVVCSRCDGHLGHVFEGERLTEKNVRHCVNSVSMSFVPAGSDPPATIKSSSD